MYVIISVHLLSRDNLSAGELRLRGWRAPETADPVQQPPLRMHQNRCYHVRVTFPETHKALHFTSYTFAIEMIFMNISITCLISASEQNNATPASVGYQHTEYMY